MVRRDGLSIFALILPGRLRCASERWSACHHVIGTVLWAVAFLLTVGPRLDYAKNRWERPFFGYPNVWMWMDDFDTGFKWMEQHPDAAALKAVPPDEMPSFANYRRTRTPDQMLARLADGVWKRPAPSWLPSAPPDRLPDSGEALAPAAGIPRLLPRGACFHRRGGVVHDLKVGRCRATSRSERLRTARFCSLARVSSSPRRWPTARATPIGRGDRFMLSLYLPLAYALIAAAERRLARYEATYAHTEWPRRIYRIGQFVLFIALLARVAQVLQAPHFDPDVR